MISQALSRLYQEEMVIRGGKENAWGYTRILGELRKLQINSVSRNTVKNILIRNGFDPGPQRGVGTWDEFLKLHAKTLWQCDFFSKRVLTSKGFRDLFVLVFLHVESRRVFITPSTFKPNEAWMLKEAAAFRQYVKATGLKAKIMMHDRDGKFSKPFDDALRDANLTVQKTAFRSPNTVAFVERFIQSPKQEVLDYFVVFGQQHMDYLCDQFAEHYHAERPHQAKDNEPLVKALSRRSEKTTETTTIRLSDFRCKSRLGGLLKHYERKAA